MDIISAAEKALKPLIDDGVTVRQGWFDENCKELHVTLWNLSDTVAAISDDTEEVDAGTIQINIWSKNDQVQLKKRIRKLMRAGGFMYLDGHDEAETDTRIFINALRFMLLQESETEE